MSDQLRTTAESRIQSGTMPPATASTLSPEALELLHKLARAEETANDALRMLHELRVHQVELDLQIEQAQENEHELEQELAFYRELWQFAPAAYFSVGLNGQIIHANRAGVELLGGDPAELSGRCIDDVVAVEFRPDLQAMLDQLRDDGSTAACEARSNGHNGSSQPVRLIAKRSADNESCLLLITDCERTESPAASC